jgi:hypothetical protein
MKINKSKSYILPLYSKYIEIKYINLVYNTYLFLEGKEENYLIIQYIKENTKEFIDYINNLKLNDLVYKIIEKEDYINVVLNIPEEIKNDYSNFVEGNYSKIKNKSIIVNFLMKNYGSRHFNAINRIKQVLNKDKSLKYELEYNLDTVLPEEIELSSIPCKQTETIKL